MQSFSFSPGTIFRLFAVYEQKNKEYVSHIYNNPLLFTITIKNKFFYLQYFIFIICRIC